MDPQADAFRPILPLVLALPLIAIAFTSRRVHVSGWHRFATIVMALTALSVSVPAAMMTVFEGRADDSFPAWMSAVCMWDGWTDDNA